MKLSELKENLGKLDSLTFTKANGQEVPSHFHITEAGLMTKHFIDCGGTIRDEKSVSLQLWEGKDTDHRLTAEKILTIINLSQKVLGNEDLEVEVEYQTDTIGRYGIDFNGKNFTLVPKSTACLASDNCGDKTKKNLSELRVEEKSCCGPESGCC